MEHLSSHNGHEEEEEIEGLPSHGAEVTLALYKNLTNYENHYNLLQNKYKQLAITWVLATFIGIGYLLSGFESALPIDSSLAVMFLCLFAAQGIFLLWFLDLGVYYKQLETVFDEMVLFEQKHKFILQFHNNALNAFKSPKKETLNLHSIFYLTFIGFLLILASIALIIYLYSFDPRLALFGFLSIAAIIIVFAIGHKKLIPYLTRKKK